MMNNKGFITIGVLVFWLGCSVFGSSVGKAINDKNKNKPTPTPVITQNKK